MNEYFTREKIKNLQDILRKYPIDTKYDEECELMLDGNAPLEQLAARGAYRVLKQLGELPDDIPKWEESTL